MGPEEELTVQLWRVSAHAAPDGSCHPHLCAEDTVQSEGCSSWEGSGPFVLDTIPGCPFLSGSFKNPLVFSKSGSYSTLTMTSSSLCVVLHGGDGVPKRSSDSLKVVVSGRGLARCPLLPGILVKPSDALAG